jgi:hypothetical protein
MVAASGVPGEDDGHLVVEFASAGHGVSEVDVGLAFGVDEAAARLLEDRDEGRDVTGVNTGVGHYLAGPLV